MTPTTLSTRPHALVIGGTRGIGRAIARRCLALGMSVTVAARDQGAVAEDAISADAAFDVREIDIGDAAAVAALVASCAPEGAHLELLIVTAGIYFNSRSHALTHQDALALMRTNTSGVAHAFQAGGEHLAVQGRGRMAAVASIAGLLKDYPGASIYAASKRAVIALCEAWNKALAPFGVSVTAIVPGYVDTAKLRALNGGDASHKPFLMHEDEAARRALEAILRGDRRAVFPWQMRVASAVLNSLPRMPKLPDFQQRRR